MAQTEDRDWLTLENEGCKIFGVMHKPLRVKSFPAVLVCHGFGGNKCGKHRIYVNLAQTLAKAGIAALRIDFRGCGDSEGDFREITLKGEVSDALVGLDYLTNHADVDASKIGIVGRSLGGVIAVQAAQQFKKAKGMVLWSPVFTAQQWEKEWTEHHEQSIGPLDAEFIYFNGRPTTTTFIAEFFQMQMEPHIQALKDLPLLHFHGNKDTTVLPEYHAAEYQRCRQGSAAESTFVQLPNSDHDFLDIDDREQMIKQTVEWLKKIL